MIVEPFLRLWPLIGCHRNILVTSFSTCVSDFFIYKCFGDDVSFVWEFSVLKSLMVDAHGGTRLLLGPIVLKEEGPLLLARQTFLVSFDQLPIGNKVVETHYRH